jgi:hypothetical protein
LFTALEAMIRSYELLPEDERARRRADDAERITGEIALRLSIARARLGATVASAPA